MRSLPVDDVDDARHVGNVYLAVAVHVGSRRIEVRGRVVVDLVDDGRHVSDVHLAVAVGITRCRHLHYLHELLPVIGDFVGSLAAVWNM